MDRAREAVQNICPAHGPAMVLVCALTPYSSQFASTMKTNLFADDDDDVFPLSCAGKVRKDPKIVSTLCLRGLGHWRIDAGKSVAVSFGDRCSMNPIAPNNLYIGETPRSSHLDSKLALIQHVSATPSEGIEISTRLPAP